MSFVAGDDDTFVMMMMMKGNKDLCLKIVIEILVLIEITNVLILTISILIVTFVNLVWNRLLWLIVCINSGVSGISIIIISTTVRTI